jgi:hypothetical protein
MPQPQTEQAILKNEFETRLDKNRQPRRDERTRWRSHPLIRHGTQWIAMNCCGLHQTLVCSRHW